MSLRGWTKDQINKARHLCKTDLYSLGKDVLKKDFVESTHKMMCEFYVKKDPKFKTFKEFALQYKEPHDRIQLVPRETYKSSIKVIDNLQWFLNWPEIRILSCTSTDDLSAAFIDELISYVTVRGRAERDQDKNVVVGGRPTMLQELFPEHCITESEATAGEFWTPARANVAPELLFKEPTAGTLSISSSSSGWHCDILDFDDPVSDRNSETGTLLEKLTNRISMITELMMNYGFRHIVGTRYWPNDPYEVTAKSHGIVELYGDYERDGLKYMCRPCMWLKDRKWLQPKFDTFPAAEDMDLFFPEGSPYESLKKKYKNRKTFFSQQMNNPELAGYVSFSEELIRSCLIDYTALPKSGMVFACWDLAASVNKGSDHTSGVVGLIDERREWWIIDIINGRFNFSERCNQIIKAISIHHPRRTGIEDSMGAQDNYREALDRTAKQNNVKLDIDWIALGAGTANAKYNRICTLHGWMTEKRIHFLNTLPYVDEMIRQFKNAGLKHADDDIADAMSRLIEQYTRYAAELNFSQPTTQDDRMRWKDLEEREFYNLIFRRGKYEEVEPVKYEPEQPPTSAAIDELFK